MAVLSKTSRYYVKPEFCPTSTAPKRDSQHPIKSVLTFTHLTDTPTLEKFIDDHETD